MKTSPTNRLCILSLFFAIISRGPVTKRSEFGLELKRRNPRPRWYDRDGRIYRLAVPVPK